MLRLAIAIVALASAEPLLTQSPAARPRLLDSLQLPVQYERVFDQRLAYYEAGPRGAPAVILIPSLTWDAHTWAQNVAAFSQPARLTALLAQVRRDVRR